MSLPFYQQQVFWDTASLWRPLETFELPVTGAVKLPAGVTYALAQDGLACRFVVKSSIDAVQTIGLVESDDLLTVDTLRMPEGVVCESNWIAVNKTILLDGSNGPYYGKCWIFRGEPRRRISTQFGPVGRTVAYVTKLPANGVPEGVGA